MLNDIPTPLLADDVMRDLHGQAKEAAATDANVLTWGGSGIGKLTWAAEIHRLSPRKSGPFECVCHAGL
jgi:DNA-binding NtrC family response regulator